MHAPTVARIALSALAHNLEIISQACSGRTIMAVIKANAYGHGAVIVGQELGRLGIRHLAVATLPEALELREAGIGGRILVFGLPAPEEMNVFADHDLDLAIGSEQILEAALKSDAPLRVHLKIDTGMTRLGLPMGMAYAALRRVEEARHLTLEGLCTHFAASDLDAGSGTHAQVARWHEVLDGFGTPPCPVHAAASGGIFTRSEVMERSTMVRPGIALYGLYEPPGQAEPTRLTPLLTLESRVVRVQRVPAGTGVSYGGRWTAPAEALIATVAAGYADGYPRRLSGIGQVGIGGRQHPVVGTICMDMLMVHLRDTEEPVHVGQPVALFGAGGPSCLEVASWADTITYEMVCGISRRVPRVYS